MQKISDEMEEIKHPLPPPSTPINTKAMEEMAMISEYIAESLKKHNHQKMLSDLPSVVKNKVQALRNLQLETTKIDAEYHREIYDIEKKLLEKHEKIFLKRRDIILGNYEPTEEESVTKIPSPDSFMEDSCPTTNEPVTGIPKFWLNIFKYAPLLGSIVKETDEPILEHLTDVGIETTLEPEMSFTLKFYFEPNKYFTNTVLTKKYFLKCDPEAEDPFSFDGPEIYKAEGCTIDWLPEKCVIAQKDISTKETVTKSFELDSFFNFFDTIAADPADRTDALNDYVLYDFEIGHYIKEKIVPRAVLYYTGEANDDIDDSSDESSLDEVISDVIEQPVDQ